MTQRRVLSGADIIPDPLGLLSGESTIQRDLFAGGAGTIALTTKVVRLQFFVARKTEEINHVNVPTGGTKSEGLTYGAFGIYAVNTSTLKLTRVTKTANTTTVFNVESAENKLALEAKWLKEAGETYALGVLCVGTKMATLGGLSTPAAALAALEKNPRRCGLLTAQESLPEEIANASLTQASGLFYGELLP
jgi:hypothetical protein